MGKSYAVPLQTKSCSHACDVFMATDNGLMTIITAEANPNQVAVIQEELDRESAAEAAIIANNAGSS